MDDTFCDLAEQFQTAIADGDQLLADDTIVRMAKAVRLAIDEGRCSLPIYQQDFKSARGKPSPLVEVPRQWPQAIAGLSPWESKARETAGWLNCAWEIAAQISFEHPTDFSGDPLSLQVHKEFRDEEGNPNRILVSNPGDWRRRAAHFSEVCKWLAKNVRPLELDTLPPVDAEGFCLIVVMNNRYPVLCTLDDFTNFSRVTASKKINQLIVDGYAIRPRGDRDGVTITPKGRAVARAISKLSAN
jgi:hypothetical protein